MIIDVLKHPSKWNMFARECLRALDKLFDIEHFALLVDESTLEINKSNIPDYYKQCLLALQELNRKGLKSYQNEILWCNSRIKFKNNVLSFKHMSKVVLNMFLTY